MMGDERDNEPGTGETPETPAPEVRRRRIIPAKSDAPPPAAEAPQADAPAAPPPPPPKAAVEPAPKAEVAAAAEPVAAASAEPGAPAAPAKGRTDIASGSVPGERRFDVRSAEGRERKVARSAATSSRDAFRAPPAEAADGYPESYDGMPRRPARTGGLGALSTPGRGAPGGRPPRSGPRPPRTDRDRPPRADRERPPRTDPGRPPRGAGAPQRGGPPAARPSEKARPVAPPPPRSQPAAPPKPEPPPKPKLDVTLLGVPQAKVQDRKSSQKAALTPKQALAARLKSRGQGGGAPAKSEAKPAAPSGERRVLSDAWLGANASQALDALREAADAAEALIDAWLKAPNVEAIAEAVHAEDLPGGARKAARRAANVLKARGITLPERTRKARFDEGGESTFEATFSPSDGTGTSVITIVERDPGGRCHIAEIVIREPLGVLRASSGWLSRSQLKEGRERAADASGAPPSTVPVEWARYRVAQAKKLNEASKQLLPLGLESCKPLIEPTPDAEPEHPVKDLLSAVDGEPAPDVTGSDRLHNEPEFRTWLPDRRALDELLRKLGAALGTGGINDPKLVDEKLAEETRASTDRFFSPEVRGIIAERMRDAAISIRQRAGDEAALRVLRVARAIRDAGLITQPPQDIPFLVTFFQKGVAILAQQGGGALRIPVAGPVPAGASEG